MRKTMIFLAVLGLVFSLNAQNTGGADVAPASSTNHYQKAASPKAQWDVLLEFNTLHKSFPGLETNGTHFFTSEWNGDRFQQSDMDGGNPQLFTITGVSYIRDMAYVESTGLFYGSDASMNLYAMDLENRSLSSTISVTCAGVTGIRHIAYDPQLNGGAGGFWIGNWNDLGAIDMNGNQLIAGINHGWGAYGSAYDNWTDPANPKLWVFCQDYSSDDAVLVEYDINTNSFTGNSYAASASIIAGGACSYVNAGGRPVIAVNLQKNPNTVRVYDLTNLPPPPVPVSNWAILLGLVAILGYGIIRFVIK